MSTSTPANSQSTSTTDLNPQINDLTHRSSNPWTLLSVNGTTSLSRTFHFRTFASAFSFMTDVAALCKKHKHHPEWSNTYNVVFVRWTTHAAGSTVGEKDVLMAGLCDGVAEEKGEKVVDEAGAGEESGKGKGMAGLADSAAGVGAECCGGGSGGGKNGVASVNEDTEGAERLREKERIESVERTEGGQGGLSGVGGQPS
ncbi:MAG: hypothetical protein M1831_007315 [Alyxoria varia]|nr:MAG: hypothetical protein M1831_007315 [Alyxoria varia]